MPRVHAFGKGGQALRRDPRTPPVLRGWLHKQVGRGGLAGFTGLVGGLEGTVLGVGGLGDYEMEVMGGYEVWGIG